MHKKAAFFQVLQVQLGVVDDSGAKRDFTLDVHLYYLQFQIVS